MSVHESTSRFKFQAVPEFFFDYWGAAQQDPTFQATTLPAYGLVDKEYQTANNQSLKAEGKKPWQRFQAYVKHLNEQESGSTTYKIVYIMRHGLGHHNVYESKVGRDAWNVSNQYFLISYASIDGYQNKWSHEDGDGEIVWADSQLNADGIEQAKGLGRFWCDSIEKDKMPLPETIYTSPLARCLETTRLVFADVVSEQGGEFHPVVKELLRERLTDHTCDRRSKLAWIKENYPDYVIESGFSEEDKLWDSSKSETVEEHVARKQKLLDDIFATDDSQVIALTTHSYAMSAILRALGTKEFRVREASSVALLVKAEKVGKDKD